MLGANEPKPVQQAILPTLFEGIHRQIELAFENYSKFEVINERLSGPSPKEGDTGKPESRYLGGLPNELERIQYLLSEFNRKFEADLTILSRLV